MLNRRLLLFLCCFGLLLLSRPATALEVPPLNARVNDTAGMFSQQVVSQTENILSQFEASDSTQIVVLTVPSLEGDILEEYSMRVVEAWKIGQKGLDNGALLLITRDDRRLRIEVGYGLEGSLTDLTAGRIIGQVIVPNFKKGDFDAGLSAGVQAMIQAVRGEFTASEAAPSKPQGSDPAGLIFLMIFVFTAISKMFHGKKTTAALAGGVISPILGFIMLPQLGMLLLGLIPLGALGGLFVSSLSASSGGGGGFYMGGGGFGGSSGGFGGGFGGGGGSFGGGGASGGW